MDSPFPGLLSFGFVIMDGMEMEEISRLFMENRLLLLDCSLVVLEC